MAEQPYTDTVCTGRTLLASDVVKKSEVEAGGNRGRSCPAMCDLVLRYPCGCVSELWLLDEGSEIGRKRYKETFSSALIDNFSCLVISINNLLTSNTFDTSNQPTKPPLKQPSK